MPNSANIFIIGGLTMGKKDMLGQVIRKIMDLPEEWLGVVFDLLEKLIGESGREWLDELKKFLCKETCWTRYLLKLDGSVKIPATTKKFIAKDKFVVNNGKKSGVKISEVGSSFGGSFKERFLDKIEDPINTTILSYHDPMGLPDARQTINKLGGEGRAETALAEMYSLMEKQGNGESGDLLTGSSCTNIFYIRDIKGVLCEVLLRWRIEGWEVTMNSFDNPDGWGDYRVFFH